MIRIIICVPVHLHIKHKQAQCISHTAMLLWQMQGDQDRDGDRDGSTWYLRVRDERVHVGGRASGLLHWSQGRACMSDKSSLTPLSPVRRSTVHVMLGQASSWVPVLARSEDVVLGPLATTAATSDLAPASPFGMVMLKAAFVRGAMEASGALQTRCCNYFHAALPAAAVSMPERRPRQLP